MRIYGTTTQHTRSPTGLNWLNILYHCSQCQILMQVIITVDCHPIVSYTYASTVIDMNEYGDIMKIVLVISPITCHNLPNFDYIKIDKYKYISPTNPWEEV